MNLLFAVNWTSTKTPLWQTDCEEFRKLDRPFELRDVKTPEHDAFVLEFSLQYHLCLKKVGTNVTFIPKDQG